MSAQLLKRVEEFRKQRKFPILTLCRLMDVHNVTFHRWKKAGKITGAYKKIVEDFLDKNQSSIDPAAAKQSTSTSQNNSSDIAVIGIACYYPGASNVRELWENILSRRVQFRRMLDQRLPLSEYYDEDPKSPEKTYLTKAAFLENFQFDWGRLRIPKKTVESTDIAHWLALDIALKTFEDAGYKLSEIPLQNTGVIVGNTLTGEQTRSQTLRLRWPYVQKVLNATLGHLGKSIEERSQIASEMEKIYKSAFYPITEDSLAGGLANTIAGRICNYLNLKGGGYIVDGACSSSLLAVATAADALKMGNMDLALAGGVDISLDPFELVGFAKAGALAKDQMRVYDQKANGFLPGEGCGFVLLKRLNDAIRDKNYVYAVIKGWGISSDGKGGIMEPSSSGQSFAIGRAYKDLEYKISDVDFVEGHGTGTTKGDRVELEGIATAIDKTVKKEDENKRACGVTSFKSIVGHTKAAAGIGGLIKAVLAVNQRVLPPTANCTHPNEVFKDKAKNLYPIIYGSQLPQDQLVRAGISSAGFGGINCHITVESKDEPKKELRSKLDKRALFVSHQETEVFVFTSRTVFHLKKVIEKFKEDLRNISLAEMADLAALLNKKVKNRLPIKATIVTHSPERLYEALVSIEQEIQNFNLEEGKLHRIKSEDPLTTIILSNGVKKCRIGFLYPGQGSQRINMTRNLVERYQWARDLFDLSKLPLFEKVYLATDKFLTKEEQQEFEKQLSDTRITQPAVVLSSLIWSEFFSKLGIEPQITVGHSLGELLAFHKAGAFNKETLIKFAQFRGELMAVDSRSSGSMVSLFCSKEKAEELIEKVSGNIVIANVNSPKQIVVSGGKKEIEKIKESAQRENIPAYQLNVSNAFHSSFMTDASNKIRKNKILPDHFKNNEIKIYSGMTAAIANGKIDLNDYFSKQVISPVNFVRVIEQAAKECDLMIELGPGRVLTDLVKAIDENILCLPVESLSGNDRDLNIVLAEIFVRNIPVKWEELYKNRLIKTFVPASRKKFIENQCERPLKIDKLVVEGKFLPILLKVKDDEDQLEDIIPGGLPEIEGKDKVADLLMALTHEITGFECESISLNLRLLDDLNLDSIKAAELIGKAARTLGVPGQVDPSQLSNNTLGQIRDRLNELVASAKAGSIKESFGDILKRYQDKTWVRNFIPVLKPEEIKTKNVNQLKELKNVFFLSGESENGLVEELENEFKVIKAKTQKINFGESVNKSEKITPINCLIAVLPKNLSVYCHSHERGNSGKEFSKDSLKTIIEQMHQITDLANSNRLGKDSIVVFVQFVGGGTAIASTLFLERSDLKVRIIDFDEKTDDGKASQKIIDELQTYEKFSNVKYDSKLARKVVYYDNSYPVDYKKRDILWSKKDVVIVTGGAKGITAQCALEFARSTNARMVLIGRSPMPKNIKDETSEIVQILKQFEKENLKASYYQCDVTNEKDVVSVIGEIEKKIGKITGFIHGAGLNSLKRLKQSSVQEAFQEALPKVMGAVNICNALKDHPPKLIAAITSIIGLTGMEGSGWYGLANEILNLYLSVIARNEATKRSFSKVVTIAYSVWDEVGMGAKLGSVNKLAEKGIGAIPVKEGVKHFRQLIEGDPEVQQVIVAARVAGIATWKSPELKINNFRFLEKIEYILPGVELIAQANLNIEDDPYLLDHNWKGSLLFPFVFGFEAMAQAVAYVLGIEKFDQIKAKDINLQRPISVSQESGTTIEIHAQVIESEKKNGPQQIKVEIYSQESAYKEPHFSAIFIISDTVIPAKAGIHNKINSQIHQRVSNVIDLNMQTDIYGPILFQGKSFQCIEKIHKLYYNEKTGKGECVFTSVYNKSADEFLKKNKKFNKRFLIGDPFFIDSLLQSMQIMIPKDISLPRSVDKIAIFLKNDSSEECEIHSSIRRNDNDYYKASATTKGMGLSINIENCRLKILDILPNNPSANELVDPTQRDQKIIEAKLSKLSQSFRFTPPIIKCQYFFGLNKLKKEERHKAELPLMIATVNQLLKSLGRDFKVSENNFEWTASGKPSIRGREVGNIEISISHNNNLIVCVAGHGVQGCDVELKLDKTQVEWIDIVGIDNKKLLIDLISKIGDVNLCGIMIWSAIEVLRKINHSSSKLSFEFSKEDWMVFKNNSSDQSYILITTIKFTNLKERVFAFYFEGILNFDEKSGKHSYFKQFGFNQDEFEIQVDYSGPQNQYVFSKQFPVTFKANQLLSRRVYFTNYFDWMGDLREYALRPIMKNISELLETGAWGLATNSVNLEILGEVRGNDVLIGRVWREEVVGNSDSIFDICFEWIKKDLNNEEERVAYCKQRTSWIKILGHGLGALGDLPHSISSYMNAIKPRIKEIKSLKELNEPFKKFSLGEQKYKFTDKKIVLNERTFDTTLENSNLVGNVYFSNYAKWMGIIEDLYFYNLIPEYYEGKSNKSEFICLSCDINHLNEAMPFDSIKVEMFLHSIYENGLDLDFEYQLFYNGKMIKKLAFAKQKLMMVIRKKDGEVCPCRLPQEIYDSIEKFI